jgi:hypothetical protein
MLRAKQNVTKETFVLFNQNGGIFWGGTFDRTNTDLFYVIFG